MRIIFNFIGCGSGNNGGSRTVILSANTLKKLGHEVYIIDSGKSKYTWDKIEVPYIIVKKNKDVPDADTIISTGYKTVNSTIKLPERCGKKYIWIRAWETWIYSEKQIIEKILKAPINHLVNSICLQNKLKSYGFESDIIRPGNDFKLFNPPKKRENKPFIIGGLYHIKQNNRKRSDWILKAFKELYKTNKSIKLYIYGVESEPKIDLPYQYWKSPNKTSKEIIYQLCDIWCAPTSSEGLHMPPQEAMLTECPIIGTSAPLSGMQDYLIHEKTGLVSDNNFESFLKQIKRLINNKELRKELGKKGRQKIIELGSREENMIELISLLESKKNDI